MNFKKLLPILLIILVGFAGYFNSFDNGFQFDDVGYIVENPHIRDINRVSNIVASLNYPVRFIPMYTFALNYHFHQTDVFGYHVVNFLIHIFAAIFVWWFVRLLFLTPRMVGEDLSKHKNVIALMAALLFVAHPIQTQAVTYICQRFASLATLFYVASMCFYVKGRVASGGYLSRVSFFVLAALMAGLGMFTKEIVFTLPVAIILFEWIFLAQRSLFSNLKKSWPFLVIILSFILVIPIVLEFTSIGMIFNAEAFASSSHQGDFITPGRYLLTQFRVIVTYIRLLFLPIGLNLDYDFVLSYSLFELDTFLCFVFLLFVFLTALWVKQGQPLLAFGILWFFLTLSVESSIIPIQHVIFEHRVYLPSVGFFLFVAAGLFQLIKNQKQYAVVLSSVILVLTLLTIARNNVWQDGTTLWRDVIAKSPNKSRGYLNLGYAYIQKEEYALAEEFFNKALEIYPVETKAYHNRGAIFEAQKKYDRALEEYNQALALEPESERAYNNRGIVYEKQKKYDLALADYNKALELNPKLDNTYNNRGLIYKYKKQYKKALADYNTALDFNPNSEEVYNNRADVYKALDQLELVLKDYNQALSINPDFAEAYNNRGVLYKDQRQFKKALADFNKAIELNPEFKEAYNNRGVLFKEMNQYNQAIAEYNKVIQLSPNSEEAYNNRGIVYKTLGKYDLALRDYNTALAINPNYTQAYTNRGVIYEAQRQFKRALTDYNKALELDPLRAEVYNNRGVVYKSLNKFDEALADYNKAISIRPNYAMALNNRGVIYKMKKDSDLAMENFSKAIEVDPQNPLAYFNRGNILAERSEFDRALVDLNTYLELQPNSGMGYFIRSLVFHAEQKYPQALEDALKAKSLGYKVSKSYVQQLTNFVN